MAFQFYENPPLQLDGLAPKDVLVRSARSGDYIMSLGMTINLYCQGHRDTYGPVYKRLLEDIQARIGHCFESHNDNGKLRKITAKAVLKEHAEFDPLAPSEKRRYPIVAISRYPTRAGEEMPPVLHTLYSDNSERFSLSLSLPLDEDLLDQTAYMTERVKSWLPGLPLFCGSITPSLV